MAMTENQGQGGTLITQAISAIKRDREGGRTNPFGYLFIAPALGLYMVFNLWPMFRGFAMAFTDYRFIAESTRWSFNGLDNFKEILTDKVFLSGLGISLRYLAMYLPLMFILSVMSNLFVSWK